MKNQDQPAFSALVSGYDGRAQGLTKREYFVGQILAGINIESYYNHGSAAEETARVAIRFADEILNQLENPKP